MASLVRLGEGIVALAVFQNRCTQRTAVPEGGGLIQYAGLLPTTYWSLVQQSRNSFEVCGQCKKIQQETRLISQ